MTHELKILTIFFLTIVGSFSFIYVLDAFGQTRPPYDDEPIIVEKLIQIESRIEKLENSNQVQNTISPEIIIAAAALFAAIFGTLLSDKRTRAALKLSKSAHENGTKNAEANILLQIENKFTEKTIKELMNDITNNRTLKEKYQKGDLHDYLSIFEFIYTFMDNGLLSKRTVEEMYGSYILTAWENPEIQEYLESSRKKFEGSWSGFIKMAKFLK